MATHSLDFDVGYSWTKTFKYMAGQVPADITGWDVVMRLRDDTGAIILKVSTAESSVGTITVDTETASMHVSITYTAMTRVSARRGTFEIEFVTDGGRVFPFLDGPARYHSGPRLERDTRMVIVNRASSSITIENAVVDEIVVVDRGPPGISGINGADLSSIDLGSSEATGELPPSKMEPGGNNTLLGTNGSGNVGWYAYPTVNTTAPLTGGGSLSGDLTLTISEVSNSAKGAVPAVSGGDRVFVSNAGGTATSFVKLLNAHVDAAAAIAGTKIAPDFGSQAIRTTGSIGLGSGTISTGALINVPHNTTVLSGIDSTGLANRLLARWGINPNQFALGNDSSQLLLIGQNASTDAAVQLQASGSVVFQVGSARCRVNTQELVFGTSVTGDVLFGITADTNGPAARLIVRGEGISAGNNDGGDLLVQGGRRAGTGKMGHVRLQLNYDDTAMNFKTMLHVSEHIAGQRMIGLFKDIIEADLPAGTGDLVLVMSQVASAPTVNPAIASMVFWLESNSFCGRNWQGVFALGKNALPTGLNGQNISLLATGADFEDMVGGIFIENCTTAPTANPNGGVFVWAEGGALKARGGSGTVTTLAAA